jgi:mortality factor 4-like protein 1
MAEQPAADGDDYDGGSLASVDFDLSTLGGSDVKSVEGDYSPENDDDDEDEAKLQESTPEPKYEIYQRVYARDKDGVMYESVVRRRLYGSHNHKQAQFGLVENDNEAQELLKDEPAWHYYVHYNNWAVNWDRWVAEDDIYEPTDQVKAYAARLLTEHRDLRKSLSNSKAKGKKLYQTINGVDFLRAWRKRMVVVAQEMNIENRGDVAKVADEPIGEGGTDADAGTVTAKATKVPKQPGTWTKAALAMEKKLREKSLTTKRKQSHSGKIMIPFTLKKILVEQWEIISQCQMLPSLPASVTVRQALDQYVESKGVVLEVNKAADETEKADEPDTEDDLANENGKSKAETIPSEASDADKRAQEWREMADGIAMFFDEAVPDRILYREEIPQSNVLDSFPDLAMKPCSEIYGCEHLLRLFVRLPELLEDELSEAEARPILAKVNDFVRFLNKNQNTLFLQSYRKLNDLEVKEQQKLIKNEERKHKRAMEGEAAAAAKKSRLSEGESASIEATIEAAA